MELSAGSAGDRVVSRSIGLHEFCWEKVIGRRRGPRSEPRASPHFEEGEKVKVLVTHFVSDSLRLHGL